MSEVADLFKAIMAKMESIELRMETMDSKMDAMIQGVRSINKRFDKPEQTAS